MAAGGEFVEGWLVAQVLGEGAYGEVRLLVHSRTGACVALKAVAAGEGGAREAALHRALRHPHVLRCLGERRHLRLHYLFLEYAQGGELFDRIEPDVGMPPAAARRLMRQLVAGLAYLHARGVAHRDVKPENLLLDHADDLKISDFGLATVFRHGARERLLARVCGTVPYAAPEVLGAARRPYRAPPADVWAAALVLLAMLAGADGARRVWCSQPAGAGGAPDAPDLSAADMDALLCYSQPAHADEALPASPPDACTPLVRRGTRVWLRCDDAAALRALAAALAGARCAWRRVHPRIFAIECADEVRMRAWALPAGGAGGVGGEGGEAQSVVEFRRSRGCGLAFKRRYLQLRRALLERAPGAEPPPRAHALAAPLHALAPAAEPMDC